MAKKKDEKTNVMRILDQKKVPYTPHFYEEGEGPEGTRDYGVHVAQALGQDPKRAFKTLVAKGASGTYHVFDIPTTDSLDLKKAAKAAGEKSVAMIQQKELLPLTGYVHGGCSPIGMKKRFPTVIDASALTWETVIVSAGKIGVSVELTPRDLLAAAGADVADVIVADGG